MIDYKRLKQENLIYCLYTGYNPISVHKFDLILKFNKVIYITNYI